LLQGDSFVTEATITLWTRPLSVLDLIDNRGHNQSESQGANPGCPEEKRQFRSGQARYEDFRCIGKKPDEGPHNENDSQQATPGRSPGRPYQGQANQFMASSHELQSPYDGEESQEEVVYGQMGGYEIQHATYSASDWETGKRVDWETGRLVNR
jgi:hypothetical protein